MSLLIKKADWIVVGSPITWCDFESITSKEPRSDSALQASSRGDTVYCNHGISLSLENRGIYPARGRRWMLPRGQRRERDGGGLLRLSDYLRMSLELWSNDYWDRLIDLDWSTDLFPSAKVELLQDGGCLDRSGGVATADDQLVLLNGWIFSASGRRAMLSAMLLQQWCWFSCRWLDVWWWSDIAFGIGDSGGGSTVGWQWSSTKRLRDRLLVDEAVVEGMLIAGGLACYLYLSSCAFFFFFFFGYIGVSFLSLESVWRNSGRLSWLRKKMVEIWNQEGKPQILVDVSFLPFSPLYPSSLSVASIWWRDGVFMGPNWREFRGKVD